MELPEQYRNSKKGLINIRNDDDTCFQYCIIAALHPPKNKKTRIDYYQSKKVQEKIVPLYNWKGVKFPTSVKDVRKFEANNKIAINVFSLDKEDNTYEIHPHSISKEDFGGKAIDLLLYEKHFILIEYLDRCINSGNESTMLIVTGAYTASNPGRIATHICNAVGCSNHVKQPCLQKRIRKSSLVTRNV